MSQAKEIWEKLASEATEDEMTKKTFEALDSVERSLKGSDHQDEDRGFRLPYSSRPRAHNSRWK